MSNLAEIICKYCNNSIPGGEFEAIVQHRQCWIEDYERDRQSEPGETDHFIRCIECKDHIQLSTFKAVAKHWSCWFKEAEQ